MTSVAILIISLSFLAFVKPDASNLIDWQKLVTNGAICDSEYISRIFSPPSKDRCIEWCQFQNRRFCAFYAEKNGVSSICRAYHYCNQLVPPQDHQQVFEIYDRGQGACRIWPVLMANWVTKNFNKAFTIAEDEIKIWEDSGADFEKVICEQREGNRYVFRTTRSLHDDQEAYVCFQIKLLDRDHLRVEIVTTEAHDETGLYVKPVGDSVSVNEVCDGEVTEMHFLTRTKVEKARFAIRPTLEYTSTPATTPAPVQEYCYFEGWDCDGIDWVIQSESERFPKDEYQKCLDKCSATPECLSVQFATFEDEPICWVLNRVCSMRGPHYLTEVNVARTWNKIRPGESCNKFCKEGQVYLFNICLNQS